MNMETSNSSCYHGWNHVLGGPWKCWKCDVYREASKI